MTEKMTVQTKYAVDAVGNYLGGFAGAPIPDGATEVSGPPNHRRDIWGGSKWVTVIAPEMINSERDRRILKGTAITVTKYGDIHLTGRASDQSVYLAMLLRAQGAKAVSITNAIHAFRDASNTMHTLTPDQVIEMVSKAMAWFEAVMKVSWAMKDGSGDFTGGIPADYSDDKHWP